MGTRRGLALLELMVVIAIMGILMAVMVPALARARWTSRCARCAANLHVLGQAILAYEADRDRMPAAAVMPPPFRFPGQASIPPLYDVLNAELPRASVAYRCPDDGAQVYDRCAVMSAGHWGISYLYVNFGEAARLDVRDVVMWDYNGDSLHGLIVPPLHGGKMQNALHRDGSVQR